MDYQKIIDRYYPEDNKLKYATPILNWGWTANL